VADAQNAKLMKCQVYEMPMQINANLIKCKYDEYDENAQLMKCQSDEMPK